MCSIVHHMATVAGQATDGAEEIDPAVEAFLGSARDLTERLSAIPDDHPCHAFAARILGDAAVNLRQTGEHLRR